MAKNLLEKEYSTPRRETWVTRLLSGKTRKAKNALKRCNGGMCCLGVEIETHHGKNAFHYSAINKEYRFKNRDGVHAEYMELGLHSHFGNFVNSKGDSIKIENHEDLIDVNDRTSMTHKEIGEFIIKYQKYIFRKNDSDST